MASFTWINGQCRAQIRRKGHRPLSKFFPTERAAQVWAREIESAMDHKRHLDPAQVALTGVIKDYRALFRAPFGRSKAAVIDMLDRELGHMNLAEMTPDVIIRWGRHRGVAPPTLAIDLSFLGSLLRHARLVMRLPFTDPMPEVRAALKHARLLGKPRERERRPTADELERISAWFDQHSALPMRDIIAFAVLSSFRAEEITRITWRGLNRQARTVLVTDRKDPREKLGNDQEVPLLDAALVIIERQPKDDERIFPYNHKTFSSIFPRACRALGIRDLRFHDLRHEAISRLFELGYQIQEVALFSGHKDWKQLRRYTQLKAAMLRRLG